MKSTRRLFATLIVIIVIFCSIVLFLDWLFVSEVKTGSSAKAMVSLSFDDGRVDNYKNAYPLLKELELPATFNITTGYVLGERAPKFLGTTIEAMTPEMVQEISLNPIMEIAGHGDTHDYSTHDMMAWKGKLGNLINASDSVRWGFAVPGTAINLSDTALLKKLSLYGIDYVRVSCRYSSYSCIKIFSRKVSRIIKFPIFYKWAYMDTLIDEQDKGDIIVYSVPLLSSVTFEQLKNLIDFAVEKRKHIVIMLHSVKDEVDDNWTYPYDEFKQLCHYLKTEKDNGRLNVVTTNELYKAVNN